MPLQPRQAYMSQLAPDDCDICYEPMTRPTRTACRHYYCFECLENWLLSNNSCPTCRAQLFEETAEDTEQEVEAQLAPGPRASRADEVEQNINGIMAGLDALEMTVAGLAGAQDHQPERGAEVHNDEPPTMATFSSNAMLRLLLRLLPELQTTPPDWFEEVTAREYLRYTFLIDHATATAKLYCGSYDLPSWYDEEVPDEDTSRGVIRVHRRENNRLVRRVAAHLGAVEHGLLFVEVQRLDDEEAGSALEPLRVRERCL
ncbi:hypothetical protein BST61_g1374 [Cercospora zeina]